jgi:dTDP-4-dehydrorhamnose 3,5-epimerase
MRLAPTRISGAFLISAEAARDERGFFVRAYCYETLRRHGSSFGSIRQTSLSFNRLRRTLRGLHWQAEEKPEGKIVRAVQGRVFDVIVDLRRGSTTYREWISTELDAENHNAILIPPGCAHGFLTLVENCTLEYVMDADFDPNLARGCPWNDPAFAIRWPFPPETISERDKTWPDFAP